MKYSRIHSCLWQLYLGGALLGSAQLAADELPEIIVISAGQQAESWLNSPASVELQYAPEQGILIDSARLLGNFSGLQADSRANFAQDTRLTLRGFGSRSAFGIRGLYLQQDGIPLLTPDGQGQLSSVLLEQVNSIEVLKGPLAALYGNSAGGVISLYSRQPQKSQAIIQTALHQEHHQYLVSSAWVADKQSVQVTAKDFKTDGFRPHSAARKQQAAFNWQRQLTDELQLTVRADWSYDPYLQDPQGLTPEQWQQNPEQTHSGAMLFDTEKSVWQRQFSASLSASEVQHPWQLSAWQGKRRISQRLAFTGEAIASAGGDIEFERHYQGINGQYRYQLTPALQTTIGGSLVSSTDQRAGYVNQFGERGELRRQEDNEARNSDVFLRFSWQPAADWLLQGGIRHSQVKLQIADYFIVEGNLDDSGSKSFSENALALALSYRLTEQLNWYISTGQGFETPTLAEIAYSSSGTGPNLALSASTNTQWETGLKWLTSQGQLSLSLFRIDTDNELVVDISSGGRTSYRNAAETRRQGIELQGSWQPSPLWQHQFSAHYLDAEFRTEAYAGNRLPGIARYQLGWYASFYPLQQPSIQLQLRSHYRADIAADDANLIKAPSGLNLDLTASFRQQWSNWQLSQWLEASNLTDRKLVGSVIVNQANGRAFEPAPGRQFSAGIGLQYQW